MHTYMYECMECIQIQFVPYHHLYWFLLQNPKRRFVATFYWRRAPDDDDSVLRLSFFLSPSLFVCFNPNVDYYGNCHLSWSNCKLSKVMMSHSLLLYKWFFLLLCVFCLHFSSLITTRSLIGNFVLFAYCKW